MQRLMRPIRADVEGFLLRGLCSGNPTITGMCQELYTHRQWLWTFLEVDGVEPTNNASERALRHAVIWRRLSFGTQSAARQPLRGHNPHGRGNLPPTIAQRVRLSDRRDASSLRPRIRPVTARQGVNDYVRLCVKAKSGLSGMKIR